MADGARSEAGADGGGDHARDSRGDDSGHVHRGGEPGDVGSGRASCAGALAKLEHLVVQDLFLTETAYHADVVLPASAFPEKDGTFTNTDRRVQLGRKVLEPPGQARADWWIIQEIARRMGLEWAYEHPRDVFAEMRQGMRSLHGITWERLEREGAVTYPCAAEDEPGQEILFGDGFPTTSGRGRFVPADVLPPDEMPDEDYPTILMTGRVLEHWHTGAMTRRASVLDEIEPEPIIQIHPDALRTARGRAGRFVAGDDPARVDRAGGTRGSGRAA